MELRARRPVGLDALGPGNRQRITCAAEMRGDQFGVAEGRVACPGPTGVVHVVHFRAAECVEPADLVQRRQLLFDGVGDVVLGQQLAYRAPLALGAGTVVAEDVEDECVVADALAIDLVDDSADLDIDMLGEAGEQFHQAPLEGAFRFRDAVPACHRRVVRRELGVRRYPAKILLMLERALSQRVPAIVEPAFVLVSPLFENVVRPVRGAGRPVQEERFVGRVRAMLAQPRDRLVGEVFAQVIILAVRRLDRVEVLDQSGFPL